MSFADVVGANLLIAIRDGLRALHRSSIQIAGPGPEPKLITADRIQLRRAFVSEVCHKFISNHEVSPTNRQKCDGWDSDAAAHCSNPDTPQFEKKCHAGFSCVSQGIYYRDPTTGLDQLVAMIFAGERLVEGNDPRPAEDLEGVLETFEADIASDSQRVDDSTFLKVEFEDAWQRSERAAKISPQEWHNLKRSLLASAHFLAKCYEIGLAEVLPPVTMIGRALAAMSHNDREHLLPVVAVGLLGVNARWSRFFDQRNPALGEGIPIPCKAFVLRAELVPDMNSLDAVDAHCLETTRDLLADVAKRDDVNCVPDGTGLTAVFAMGDNPTSKARDVLDVARRWANWQRGPGRTVRVCCGLSCGVVACGPHSLDPPREAERDDFEPIEAGPACLWTAVGRPVLAAKRAAHLAHVWNTSPAVAMDNEFRAKLPTELRSRYGARAGGEHGSAL